MPRLSAFVAAAGLCSMPGARADGTSTHLGTVDVEAARERGGGPGSAAEEEAPGFVTIIPVDRPSARIPSVAELVQREAGIRVRSAGGLGTWASVSVRGSDAAEVAVYLDGVPLNLAASGSVDLSQLPVDGLERVEIYRGLVPPELGGQSVGGAINLVSRKGERAPRLRASVGGGSFGTRAATVGYGLGGRAFHADASASYRGSTGDFVYYFDNGTLLDTSDDRAQARRNNGFDQGAADVELGGAAGAGGRTAWSLGAHGFLKSQGVAGRAASTSMRAPSAGLLNGRVLVQGSVDRRGLGDPSLDAHLGAQLLLQRSIFDNHAGDLVGSGRAERSESDTLVGRFDARLQAATAWDLFSILVAGSVERYQPHDLLGTRQAGASERLRIAITVADDIRLLRDRLTIAPAVRFEGIDSRIANDPLVFAGQAVGQETGGAWLSPQLGVRGRVLPWLQIKASVARSLRVPTLMELFGDRAFVLPSPGLRPEVALGGDAGLAADLQRGPLGFAVEGAFFGRRVEDYIALTRTSYASRYDNVGSQRFLGCELRGRAHAGSLVAVTLDYTFIKSINETADLGPGSDGKPIPGVPAHKLDLRADLERGPFGLYYELAWVSDVFLTAQQELGTILPARALHALGVHAGPFPGVPLRLTVEIANLGDLRVVDQPLGGTAHAGETRPQPLVDFKDYPLPGRSFFVTLAWQP